MSEEKFSEFFYLEHKTGHKLYPVKVKNRESGVVAFRVSVGGKKGNTKEIGQEVHSEQELEKYVKELGYAVRAATKNGEIKGLYKIGHRSIVKAVFK